MVLEASHFLSAIDLPQAHRLIIAAGEHVSAIGQEGHGADAVGVPFKLAQLLARLDVPQSHGMVDARGDDRSAIWR